MLFESYCCILKKIAKGLIFLEGKRCQSCFREYKGNVCPHCGGAQNEEHQLQTGTMIRDRYKIGKVLGQGGFGITYMAWDILMEKCVAVKEFYPGGTVIRKCTQSNTVECTSKAKVPHYERSRERFLREAQALVKFQDIPEVVTILDFVKENNTAYIVMEYVRGVHLGKYIRMRGGRLSVEETFRILRPVMEALAKVHKGGIVHRDISPDNIMLGPMGAKLLDFGAVRTVEDPGVEKELNKSTEAILKHGFAPIEQYNTRGSLGPWTDEYAMCATIWYCLTGKVLEEASVRLCDGIDPDWSTIEGLTKGQQEALHKGLSCRAKDRFENIDALLKTLFPEEVPSAVSAVPEKDPIIPSKDPDIPEKDPVITDTTTKNETVTSTKTKKKLLWIPIAVIAVALIAAAGFLLLSPFEEPGGDPGSPSQTTIPTSGMTAPTADTSGETTQPATEPEVIRDERYLQAEQLLAEGKLGEAAIAFGKLGDLADARERSFQIWAQIADRTTLTTGTALTVGIRNDGTAVAAGSSKDDRNNVSGWTDLVSVSAGVHTVGLRADGTVVATGLNDHGQCDVSGWTDIVAISAGSRHTVGLRADGTAVAVGKNLDGECNVSGWTDLVAISAGEWHTIGLKADGTVVATGQNYNGQGVVSGWTDIVAISAGSMHTVGLRADGTVVATGYDEDGRCSVYNWTDIVAISAGYWHTAGLRADGTAVTAGSSTDGRRDVADWTDLVAVSADLKHTAALRSDGTVVAAGNNENGQCNVSGWTDIRIPQERVPFR